jgi:hypothetical protein
LKPTKATSGFEPLLPDEGSRKRHGRKPATGDDSELNPFLTRVLERVKQCERERAK